jgi:hypothetical protein
MWSFSEKLSIIFTAMKPLIIIFFLFTFNSGCKCRLANEPGSLQYWSISESKKNGAFVHEYKPQSPFFLLDGKSYYIDEAWVEHPYFQRNFYDEIEKGVYSFVMTFKIDKKSPFHKRADLPSYIRGVGNGDMRIWFFLSDIDKNRDTITIHFRDSLNSPEMNKTFLVFRK